MNETELDLREVFRILRRRFALILMLPLVAAIGAWLISSFVIRPVYRADTTLWVIKGNGSEISYNDVLLNQNLTRTYAEIARSRAVLQPAIQRLGVSLTVEQLQEKLTTAVVRDTGVFRIEVEDYDPVLAAELANAIASSFQDQIRTFMKVENVAVVDPAVPPAEPVAPRPLLNTAVALVLGAMVAVGLAFLLEYLDTSIKSTEDLQRHVGLPVLAVIPQFDLAPQPGYQPRRHPVHALEAERQ